VHRRAPVQAQPNPLQPIQTLKFQTCKRLQTSQDKNKFMDL
jgi:hypothetical protein